MPMDSWRRFRRHSFAFLSLCFLLALALVAFLAPWFSHFNYYDQNADMILQSPSSLHWFGTDSLGRDLYARLLFGARISLAVGFFTALFSLVIGGAYGAVAGYLGGALDNILMRMAEIISAMPSLLITVLLMMILGHGPLGIFLALGMVGWVGDARLVRGLVLQAKELPYVEAAQALGLSRWRILFRHVFPNILGPVIVSLSFGIPQNILAESFLSFVGLGLEPPYASWGTLANEGWRAYRTYPHLIVFPGLALFFSILAFNFLGDGLRDALDPQARKV